MALFFDRQWFDRKLGETGKSHNDLAAAMGIELMELAAIWKDQRELSAAEVMALAAFLSATPAEVADHAGVSTPVPSDLPANEGGSDMGAVMARLDDIVARLERLERAAADVKALALDIRTRDASAGSGVPDIGDFNPGDGDT